ncbi:MAG: polysaccharide biosynthesis tyrosine autokinase [Candidatus Omnitrophica bacterium]|nr:polysaccharide biosynthesis tyrosine autokinase [Candidatus Omnitrophota bacterium]
MDTPIQEREIEINLQDYLRIIQRRRWAIFTFFVVTVFTVTIATFLMVPIYRATSTVLIDEETPDALSVRDNFALGSSGYIGYREYYQTQLEIIKSRAIAKEVYYVLQLANIPEFAEAKDPIELFLKKLKVEPSRNTRLVYIHFEDKDKEIATSAVNKLASVYAARNLIAISKNENVNLIKNEYLKLQSKYSEMNKIYKDKHPQMIRLKQEIAQMEERMRKEQEDPFKATGLKSNNVRVIDEAEVPKNPVRPKKAQNILIAMIAGLLGGVGLAFLADYLDNTVKTADDVERLAKLPLLGYVPTIESKYSEIEKDKFVHLMPKSAVSEGYRAIRTSILFSSPEEQMIRDILVTSAGPKEGKSTTVSNLAITMASSGNTVLLVDADMRKPRVHTIFKIKNDVGLSSFLTGKAGLEEVVRKTDVPNLSIVTCGHIPPNPSELLGTKRMKEFIEQAKTKFDRIFFDSPPLTIVTDSVVLSGIIGNTVVVINSKKTSKSALHHSKQLLTNARANVLGVVLNNLVIERGDHYYSHHYYYSKDGSYYGKDTDKEKIGTVPSVSKA